MKTCDSNDSKKASAKRPALRLVAYGLAMAETLVVSLGTSCTKCFTDLALANSTRRDTPAICKTARERFVWTHGLIAGMAIGTGVFTIGLGIALWISIQ